jgi:hypothetical protein
VVHEDIEYVPLVLEETMEGEEALEGEDALTQ